VAREETALAATLDTPPKPADSAVTTDTPSGNDSFLAESAQLLVAPERPRVANHEILDELGRGGIGVVYKARQTRLNRLVALKMLLAGGHASKEQLARFYTEAQAIARLTHPNIVQVYEVGDQDGLPYFSLEFVDGGSLSEKLRGKPLAPQPAAELVQTLARAMYYAHQQGIMHRDPR